MYFELIKVTNKKIKSFTKVYYLLNFCLKCFLKLISSNVRAQTEIKSQKCVFLISPDP